MRLYLKNIGKIKEADIEINGITVITGYNNTGKSTVGKALFGIFNSFEGIENKIRWDMKNYIAINLIEMRRVFRDNTDIRLIDRILNKISEEICARNYFKNKEELKNYIMDNIKHMCENLDVDKTKIIAEHFEGLNIDKTEFKKNIVNRNLRNIFNEDICNLFCDDISEIRLNLKDDIICIKLRNNDISSMECGTNINIKAIYIDNPFVLDELNYRLRYNFEMNNETTERLLENLLNKTKTNIIDDIITETKLTEIYKLIESVCDGKISTNNITASYNLKDTNKNINLRSLSTGLKTFAILKILLENGSLKSNGTIILDEPEIHLHPEWQLLFAEIIVLLQKEFNMHILLTTHSPYFLNAIEVYSKKHKLSKETKYYLANNNKDNTVNVEDVTDNIEEIYELLAEPFSKLQKMEIE